METHHEHFGELDNLTSYGLFLGKLGSQLATNKEKSIDIDMKREASTFYDDLGAIVDRYQISAVVAAAAKKSPVRGIYKAEDQISRRQELILKDEKLYPLIQKAGSDATILNL